MCRHVHVCVGISIGVDIGVVWVAKDDNNLF